MQPSETKIFKDFQKVGTFVPNDGSSTKVHPRLPGTVRPLSFLHLVCSLKLKKIYHHHNPTLQLLLFQNPTKNNTTELALTTIVQSTTGIVTQPIVGECGGVPQNWRRNDHFHPNQD